MAWDGSPHGGFSTVEPWLPLHDDWPSRNLAVLDSDPTSILSLYRNLLHLRRDEPALSIGSIKLLESAEDVLAYERHHSETRLLIALNLSGERRPLSTPRGAELLLSTIGSDMLRHSLAPNEGIIVRLKAA